MCSIECREKVFLFRENEYGEVEVWCYVKERCRLEDFLVEQQFGQQ